MRSTTFFIMSGSKVLMEFVTDGFSYKIAKIHQEHAPLFPLAFRPKILTNEILWP